MFTVLTLENLLLLVPLGLHDLLPLLLVDGLVEVGDLLDVDQVLLLLVQELVLLGEIGGLGDNVCLLLLELLALVQDGLMLLFDCLSPLRALCS